METVDGQTQSQPSDAGDQTDARSSYARPGIGRVGPAGGDVRSSSQDFVYNMNHKKRGLFVLINNKTFDRSTGMSERSGTDADASNLYRQFKSLDFEVHMFTNQKAHEMRKIMQQAAEHNHAEADCFACAILSHGDEGVVYGTDGIIRIDDLVNPVKGANCQTLVGKPKLFFIQACRGTQLDSGAEVGDADVEIDTPDLNKVYRIPHEADILFAYSTVPGYYSWRNSNKGSWFVQAFSRVLEEFGKDREILWLLTRVNHITAHEFQSNAARADMNEKKQVSQIVSMLTKELYFRPKSSAV